MNERTRQVMACQPTESENNGLCISEIDRSSHSLSTFVVANYVFAFVCSAWHKPPPTWSRPKEVIDFLWKLQLDVMSVESRSRCRQFLRSLNSSVYVSHWLFGIFFLSFRSLKCGFGIQCGGQWTGLRTHWPSRLKARYQIKTIPFVLTFLLFLYFFLTFFSGWNLTTSRC